MSETSKIEVEEVLKYLEYTVDSLYSELVSFSKSEFKNGEDVIKSIDEYLFQKICNEQEYCKNKSRFSYMEIKKLAELLIQILDNIPKREHIPKSLLVAILIKIGLDRFCKC